MNNYATISNVYRNSAPLSVSENPLSYCIGDNLEQRFLHGAHSDAYGQHSRPCQLYMSEYCATNWDKFCEAASMNTSSWTPNNMNHGSCGTPPTNLTAGEILIYNTASRKYLSEMLGATKKYEPFDPTVARSPMISYWVPEPCSRNPLSNSLMTPVYEVNPDIIDADIVMDKILTNPSKFVPILKNIFNTMKRKGTLQNLKGTKLGNFYGLK